MTVTYASSVYTITGGFASGTLSSATSTSFAVGAALTTMKNRSIWITGGKGAGQRRNILTDGSATTFSIRPGWTTTPDNTSTYVISHRIDDLFAASGTGLTRHFVVNAAVGQNADKRANYTLINRIVVGNGSTNTYLKFDAVSVATNYAPTTTNPLIRINNNAIFQWGDYESTSRLTWNSGALILGSYEPTGNAYNTPFIVTTLNTNAQCLCYGLILRGLIPETTSDPSAYYIVFAIETGTNLDFVGSFNTGPYTALSLRGGTANLKDSLLNSLTFVPTADMSLTDITIQSINYAPYSLYDIIDTANFYTVTLKNCTFKAYDATLTAGLPGEASAGGHTSVKLINPAWNRLVGYLGNTAITFVNGTNLKEFFTYIAACADADNVAVQNASILLLPIAGSNATTYYAITNSSGTFTALEVQTGLWDSTCLNFPALMNPAYSNFSYKSRIRKYGYKFLEYTVNLSSAVTQTPVLDANTNITLSSGTAAGYGVTVTDHGASPVSWSSKNFGITIDAGNTLTYNQIYHALQYRLADANTAWNGKKGGIWHELLQFDGISYKSVRGQYLESGSLVSKGVRIVNALNTNGAPSTMQADDGTVLSFTTIALTGLQAGSAVALFNQSGALVESGVSSSSSYTFTTFLYSANNYSYRVRKYGYLEVNGSVALSVGLASVTVVQSVDNFITQPSAAVVAAYTGITVGYSPRLITVGAKTQAEIYDFVRYTSSLIANIDKAAIISTVDGITLSIAAGIALAGAPTGAGMLNLASGYSLTVNTAGTYTGLRFVLSSTSILYAPTGTTTVTNWDFATGAQITASATTATVIVDEDEIAEITANAGVTVKAPDLTLRLYGIPNVANAILRVKDLTSNAVTYPALTGGEATITVQGDRSYEVRADAPGYLASPFITLSGASSREYQFDLENYRDLYLSGTNRMSQILFNPYSYSITITDETSELSFADVFRTVEDYLASELGLAYTAHPFPVVLPDRNILWFPYDTAASQINPVRIMPDPGNTSDPTLLFEVYLESAADPTYDLFDFTEASGRIIRVRSVVAIANVSVSGGLSTDDRVVIDAIATRTQRVDGLIENVSGNRFTQKALEQAPVSAGGGSGATPEEIWTYATRSLTGSVSVSSGSINSIAASVETVLADDLAAIPVAVEAQLANEFSAIPTSSAIAGAVETQLANEFAAIPAAVETQLANEFSAIPAAVQTQLSTNFDAIPTAGENALAVQGQLADEFSAIPTATSIAGVVETQLANEFSSIPTASAIAAAVETQLSNEFSVIPTSSTIASAVQSQLATSFDAIPTTSEIAEAIETQLANEFSGIPVAVESQLANEFSGIPSAVQLQLATNFTAIPSAVETQLADNLAAMPVAVQVQLADEFAAVPTASAIADAVEALLETRFDAIPTAGETASAIDSQLATRFADIPGAVRTELEEDFEVLPTASEIAMAVQGQLSDEFAAIPDAGAIAGAVETRLSDEFTAIPGAVETRLANEFSAIPGAVREELEPELAQVTEQWRLEGLDPSSPLVVTKTQRQAGGIDQAIAETSESTTVTRQP